MSLYIYTYGDTGITEIDSATGSIYLEDPGVDRHISLFEIHTVSFPALGLLHSCRAFIDPGNFCGSFIMAGYLFISSHPLPMLLKREPLFFTNSLRILCEVQQSVNNGLSAF
jgi:hypothetical protein